MYEVEWKVELSKEEKSSYETALKKFGFIQGETTPQNDFYIEAKPSPFGGQDLKRYRQEGKEFIYTEKIWEQADGVRARKEVERNVTEGEYRTETARYPEAVKVIKDRIWFSGQYKDRDLSVTIDSVKFDHSPAIRFFTEAEIRVADKAEVPETTAFIKHFLMDVLERPQGIPEAPGMFTMAFKKL
jgi:adenylate cyclase class IV